MSASPAVTCVLGSRLTGFSQFSFEQVVLKGLANDGGLYLPEEIPAAAGWESWKDLTFPELAFKVMSLYISPAEIPPEDLRGIINRSYSTFDSPEVTPLVHLKDNLYLLELFHGPTKSFKDVALQNLGNLFEYFLVRKNQGKTGRGEHQTGLSAYFYGRLTGLQTGIT